MIKVDLVNFNISVYVVVYYNLNIKIYENLIILFYFKFKIFYVLIVKYNLEIEFLI